MTTRLTLLFSLAGLIGNLALFVTLLVRRYWNKYPIFTSIAGYEATRAILLFYISRHGTHEAYLAIYWFSEAIDVLLQLALLREIAVGVFGLLPHINSLLISARIPKYQIGIAVVIAIGCPLFIPAASSLKYTIDMRASLFTSLVTCELYLLIAKRANKLALRRSGQILAISDGITLWAVIAIVSAFIQELHGWEKQSVLFDQFRSAAVVLILIYWIRQFWYFPSADRLESRPYLWVHGTLFRSRSH